MLWIAPCSARLFPHLLQGGGIPADQDLLFLPPCCWSSAGNLHGGLLWIFFWQKKTSSLLKAFLLCEQRGWGAAGWRLLFPSVHFGVLGWQVSRAFRTMETKAFFFCSMQVNSHKRTTAPPASIISTKAALHSPSSQSFLVNTTSPWMHVLSEHSFVLLWKPVEQKCWASADLCFH